MSLEALAYKNLASYASYMEPDYLSPPHVITLCAHLEAVEAGLIKRLIVVMPPRHSKTYNVGEFFPAWYLGRNPNNFVIYSTYEQGLASGFGRKVKNQIADPMFTKIFPKCKLAGDSKSKKEFAVGRNGKYYAVGRGGAVNGKGAHVFLCDDIFKDHREAASELIRKDTQDWFKSTVSTRLQKNGAVILMGTRWNVDDLIGFALKDLAHENWVLLEFPAWSDNYDALWPEMFSRKRLEVIKKTLGPYFWNALYMGRPSEEEGNLFKRDRWGYWRERPRHFDKLIQSWDMNFKEGKKNSYVCGQIWGKIKADYYLLDQWRKQCDFVETLKAVITMTNRWPKATKILIEDKANGPAIISALKNSVSGIEPIEPKGSKYARAEAISAIQDSGNIIIPHPDVLSWAGDFIDECANFPNGEFDDMVDTMSQSINYMNTTGGIANLENFLKW